MPKTEQKNSRSRSQHDRSNALHTQLANRIQSLKDSGADNIMGDSRVRSLMNRIDSLSSSRETAQRRATSGGRTPSRSSGLSMNKGGLVKTSKKTKPKQKKK